MRLFEIGIGLILWLSGRHWKKTWPTSHHSQTNGPTRIVLNSQTTNDSNFITYWNESENWSEQQGLSPEEEEEEERKPEWDEAEQNQTEEEDHRAKNENYLLLVRQTHHFHHIIISTFQLIDFIESRHHSQINQTLK